MASSNTRRSPNPPTAGSNVTTPLARPADAEPSLRPPLMFLAPSLATLLTVASAAAPAAAGSEPADQAPSPRTSLVEYCFTTALTDEEAADGEVSTIECGDEPAAPARVPMASMLLATHWDGANGTGSQLDVFRTSCAGSSVVLSPASGWNDRISSTTHIACGNVKHFTGAAFDGTEQLTAGSFGAIRNMNSSLNNAVSSVRYGD